MPIMSNPPDPNPRKPSFVPPPGACDSHIHFFGPASEYPFAANAVYHAADALPETYIGLQETLGLSRAVVVHATALGLDNRRMLDALAAHPDRFRGVAVPRDDISDGELEHMHKLGVRGARFTSVATYQHAPRLNVRLAERIAELGWHAQFLLDGVDLPEMAPTLLSLACDIVIDHMGRVPADLGVGHPGFQTLLRMLDTGRVWVKVSGPMRFSKQDRFPYSDTRPFAHELAARAAERLVWGSDWPHINYNHGIMPNDGDLLDLMLDWAPDEATRNQILAENPAKLYDFPPA